MFLFFFFNDTATTEIYTLSLHDALPISVDGGPRLGLLQDEDLLAPDRLRLRRQDEGVHGVGVDGAETRSEEHTSELQSRQYLVCRLLLEKKNQKNNNISHE